MRIPIVLAISLQNAKLALCLFLQFNFRLSSPVKTIEKGKEFLRFEVRALGPIKPIIVIHAGMRDLDIRMDGEKVCFRLLARELATTNEQLKLFYKVNGHCGK